MPGKESKINRWRWPIGIGVAVALAATVAVGVGALIAHDQKPVAVPASFASKSPTPPAVDEHTKKACEINDQAADQNRLEDGPTVAEIVAEAQQSANADVLFQAQDLKIAQGLAAFGKGTSDETGLLLELRTKSLKLKTACINAGFLPKS